MAEDPKKIFVEMVGRLGRETQLHLDERHHHFRITNFVIIAISALLVILAIFNVYYVRILYKDFNGIVSSMDSMYENLTTINGSMHSITDKMELFDNHMRHMNSIETHTAAMTETMPDIRLSMSEITGEMDDIEKNMGSLTSGMIHIDQRFNNMTNGVTVMREQVRQMAKPMGTFTPFMP